MDDGADAGILEGAGEIEHGEARRLRPAFDRDAAAARIDADRDSPREALARLAHERRRLDRRGAEDDAAHATAEPGLDGCHVANAAAELNRQLDRGEDGLDRRRVDRAAGEGAVEINDVQPFEALRLEGARLRRGIL